MFVFKPFLSLIQPCNKCVAVFDHHCPYLNTCIGKQNYVSFLITLALGVIITGLVGGLGLWSASLRYSDPDRFDSVGGSSLFDGAVISCN